MLKSLLRYRMADKNIKDLTQLIEVSGLSRTALNKLYHNRDLDSLKLGTLERLCNALGCDLTELVEFTRDSD